MRGRNVVITGAGSGVGATTAHHLAGRLARIVPLDRDEALVIRLEAALPDPRRHLALATGVANRDVEGPAGTFEINVTGVVRTVHTALPHVIERRGHPLPVPPAAWRNRPVGSSYAGVEAQEPIDAVRESELRARETTS